jgi:hypothetical protein
MPRLGRSKQRSRTGSVTAKKRRSRLSRTRYLANPASLIGIPRLEPVHVGNKISFGPSALTALAQTLVNIDIASEADWTAAEKLPSTLVEHALRRYLADRGQSTIAEHFELTLTLERQSSIAYTARRSNLSRATLLRSDYGVVLCLGRG